MLLSLAAVALAVLPQDAPRLRSIADNGAVVLVERMEGRRVSVQLWASSAGCEDSPATHGQRHLLEHLALKGKDGTLDRRLEAKGILITGRTFRDAMQIEVSCLPNQVSEGLSAVAEVVETRSFKAPEIAQEAKIMRHEFALRTDAQRLGDAAWLESFGNGGLDPFGSMESLEKATPGQLSELSAAQFDPSQLAIVVAGPVDLDEVSKLALATVGKWSAGKRAERTRRGKGKAGRVEVRGAFGESRAAIVEGGSEPTTARALCAAFAVASQFPSAFVTYTPSLQPGLVIVGRTDEASGLGLWLDGLEGSQAMALYPIGQRLALNWIRNEMARTYGCAYWRGAMLCENPSARPEQLVDAILAVKPAEFLQALKMFSPAEGVVTVGVPN